MRGEKILVLESRVDLASWVEEEGRRLGLDVTARVDLSGVEGDLARGEFAFVIGLVNGEGKRIEALSDRLRPKVIPLAHGNETAAERRARLGRILGALGCGRAASTARAAGRWIERRFDEEIDARHDRLVERLTPALRALARLDHHIRDHSRRVGIYAREIGRALGLDPEARRLLTVGGWVHDVGKIRIAPETLCKPEPLEPDEWEAMTSHPGWGHDLVRPCTGDDRLLAMVLHHHEHFGGGGYPGGLKRSKIPEVARILAVADAYDAVTHDRPYRAAASHRHALGEILKHAPAQFDPDVARAALAARLDTVKV